MTEQCCKTCRHWDTMAGRDRGEGWGCCRLADTMHAEPINAPESRAVAMDTHHYRAWLETHETFGCNQWDEKP